MRTLRGGVLGPGLEANVVRLQEFGDGAMLSVLDFRANGRDRCDGDAFIRAGNRVDSTQTGVTTNPVLP